MPLLTRRGTQCPLSVRAAEAACWNWHLAGGRLPQGHGASPSPALDRVQSVFSCVVVYIIIRPCACQPGYPLGRRFQAESTKTGADTLRLPRDRCRYPVYSRRGRQVRVSPVRVKGCGGPPSNLWGKTSRQWEWMSWCSVENGVPAAGYSTLPQASPSSQGCWWSS